MLGSLAKKDANNKVSRSAKSGIVDIFFPEGVDGVKKVVKKMKENTSRAALHLDTSRRLDNFSQLILQRQVNGTGQDNLLILLDWCIIILCRISQTLNCSRLVCTIGEDCNVSCSYPNVSKLLIRYRESSQCSQCAEE